MGLGDLCTGPSRSALVVAVALQLLQQASGINVVVYFGPRVLQGAGFTPYASVLATFGVGVAQLGMTYLLMRLVDRVGRQPLALVGNVGMVGGLGALALAFSPPILGLPWARWLAVTALLLFRLAFSLSLGPLPYIITAEVFPPPTKALGVSVAWCANWAANFAVSQSFLPLLGALSPWGVYTAFAVITIGAGLYIFMGVPETKAQEEEGGGADVL